MKELFNFIVYFRQIFERLKEEKGIDSFKKLIPVAGDVSQENLGLSMVDRLTLVEHVHVVFHSAASLDFEASLKSSVEINLLGTRRVAELCQEIRDLKVLYHLFFCLYHLSSLARESVSMELLK